MDSRSLLLRMGLAAFALFAVLGCGCLMGWLVFTLIGGGGSPADLNAEYQEDYVVLIAAGYACDHDLEKAQARLEELDLPNSAQYVADLTETYIREGASDCDLSHLSELSYALGVGSGDMVAYLATNTPFPTSTSMPTAIPTDTPIPSPTATATSTPTPTPTDTPTTAPTGTPTQLPPTATPLAPTDTPAPANTSKPANTPKPKPTNTPAPPTAPPIDFKVLEAGIIPYEEGGCDATGIIHVDVLDVDGVPLDGALVRFVWSHKQGVPDLATGEKAPGVVEHSMNHGGEQVTIVGHIDGRTFTSEVTKDLRFDNPGPPLDELLAANCCAGEAQGRQIQMDDCLSGSFPNRHWDYRVKMQATHRIRP